MKKIGFDSEMYMQKQSEKILERISRFGKLYLEFGGKLFDDLHAARVLPGFDKAAKIKLLQKLKDKAELIICINAGDIEKNKVRADYGITYGSEVERMIDNISGMGIYINCSATSRRHSPTSISWRTAASRSICTVPPRAIRTRSTPSSRTRATARIRT